MPRWLAPSHPWFEPALAVALSVIGVVDLALAGVLLDPLQGVLVVLVALPVAIRFRAPLTALTLMGIFSVLEEIRVHDEGQVLTPTVCLLLGLYAVGSRLHGWRFWTGGLIVAVATATTLLVRQGVTSDLALTVLLPGVGLLIARASGVLMLETEVLHARASTLEHDRDEHTRLALEQERRRIARELHDVVGQSISVMGLQAGAVRSVLAASQRREREALLSVERVGREALAEMRRLIGLLRTDSDADSGPMPSLARLDALTVDLRSAGLDVTVSVDGELSDLPAGIDLAAYRILQEALTNVLRHAPGARVTARIVRAGAAIEIDVLDDGGATPPRRPRRTGVGHGLLGMRERAGLYGGRLEAGPRQDDPGFRVHASLPVGEAR